MSTLWVHAPGIIQQTCVSLLDRLIPNAERIVIPIAYVAVDLERLLHPELIIGCGLKVSPPVGDVLPQ